MSFLPLSYLDVMRGSWGILSCKVDLKEVPLREPVACVQAAYSDGSSSVWKPTQMSAMSAFQVNAGMTQCSQ